MERNTVSHDSGRTMIYEGMYSRSKRLNFGSTGILLKEKVRVYLLTALTQMKGIGSKLLHLSGGIFANTSVALLAVFGISFAMMLFWFALLFGINS